MVSELSKQRALLSQHIWTYQKRRGEYKLKYGESSETYKKLSKNTTLAIYNMTRKIKRLDIVAKRVKELRDKVTEFMGVVPIGQEKGVQLAKQFYYRYGLESGITGNYLRLYIGDRNFRKPSQLRLKLIRSFQKKPENKQMWMNFKEFMKDIVPEV